MFKKWAHDLNDDLNDIDFEGNTDHPTCPSCHQEMNFIGHDENGDFPSGDGYWECPNCGFSITEQEVWNS